MSSSSRFLVYLFAILGCFCTLSIVQLSQVTDMMTFLGKFITYAGSVFGFIVIMVVVYFSANPEFVRGPEGFEDWVIQKNTSLSDGFLVLFAPQIRGCVRQDKKTKQLDIFKTWRQLQEFESNMGWVCSIKVAAESDGEQELKYALILLKAVNGKLENLPEGIRDDQRLRAIKYHFDQPVQSTEPYITIDDLNKLELQAWTTLSHM